ncbi:MAG: TIGR02449 family protein [Gammaproteobacteria bacterium]|nr:TIGR02449 family protein [Gammaproteobacteria bacterium]
MDGNEDMKDLEGRIDQLIDVCQHLRHENSSLKAEKQGLTDEHTKLVEKTRLARSRIEDMIGRLKALERG